MTNAQGRVGEQLRETAAMAREDIREMGTLASQAAREKAQDLYSRGRERAKQWEEGLETYVREKPVQSLLIAAGVGLAIGFLMRRR